MFYFSVKDDLFIWLWFKFWVVLMVFWVVMCVLFLEILLLMWLVCCGFVVGVGVLVYGLVDKLLC